MAAIRFLADESKLEIEFDPKAPAGMKGRGRQMKSRGPAFYEYSDVSIREAESFYRASSKGKWVWDHLRVRGPGGIFAHRKPYALISGPSTYAPKWMRNKAARLLHGRIGPEGTRSQKQLSFLLGR